MDDELWYGVIEDQTQCSCSSLFNHFFCLFKIISCHIFSGTSESRHFIYRKHINKSRFIVIVTNRITAHIHYLFIQFSLFLYLDF